MSERHQANGSVGTGTHAVSRRRVIKSIGAASVIGTIPTSVGSAEEETDEIGDEEEIIAAIEENADDILDQLAERDLMLEGSAEELPTDNATTDPEGEGVERTSSNDDDVFIIRKQTTEGLLAVLVDTGEAESVAALRRDDGSDTPQSQGENIEMFGDSESVAPQQDGYLETDRCPTGPGVPMLGLFFRGRFLFCC